MLGSLNLPKNKPKCNFSGLFRNKSFKRLLLFGSIAAGVYSAGYLNDDFYYFGMGLKRGVKSIFTGAQIIGNYYIVSSSIGLILIVERSK